jgi:hypothetical protein
MKLLRLNQNTWINPKMIAAVTIKRTKGDESPCDVFIGNVGWPVDEFTDPKLFKFLSKQLGLPKAK